MTNYMVPLVAAAALLAGACSAAEPPAAKPAAAKPAPAATPAAPAAPARPGIAAAPAGTSTTAAGGTRYAQAAGSGSLDFYFMQAGAENHGSFRQFDTELVYDEKNPAAASLKVMVQIGSLATQDKDRDGLLSGADLFDVEKYPTAQFTSSSISGSNGKLVATGKLTLRGVTRELRVPLTIKTTADGIELSGTTSLKRLDFGVGQGEFKSTESVGDEVRLKYLVPLKKEG